MEKQSGAIEMTCVEDWPLDGQRRPTELLQRAAGSDVARPTNGGFRKTSKSWQRTGVYEWFRRFGLPLLCCIQLIVIGLLLIVLANSEGQPPSAAGFQPAPAPQQQQQQAPPSSVAPTQLAPDAQPSRPDEPASQIGGDPAQRFSPFREFTNLGLLTARPNQTTDNSVRSVTLRMNRVAGCNQREHDRPFGVMSRSSEFGNRCAASCHETPVSAIFINLALNLTASNAFVVTSSRSGRRFDEEWANFTRIDSPTAAGEAEKGKQAARSSMPILEVSMGEPRQTIIGWGGGLTDSTLRTIYTLTPNATRMLLDDYFGERGLNFNMARITIGGSDFSTRFYTHYDLAPNASMRADRDPSMNGFKLAEEDLLYKIPMLKFIQQEYFTGGEGARGSLKVMASMWSPPVWMKNNKHYNKGQLLGAEGGYRALALLKKKFLLAYLENAVPIWALTVLNEPVMGGHPFINFNSMVFPPQDYALYIAKHLGPTLRNTKPLKNIKLIAHDDNRHFLNEFLDPVLQNEEARRYVDGFSVHSYTDEEYDKVESILHDHSTGRNKLFALTNELSSGHLPFMEKALVGNWHRGVHYALDMIHSLQHQSSGWLDWNMALDLEGGPGWLGGRLDSPVIVDAAKDAFYKSPMYYAMGHFSRYIPPGARFLKHDLINANFDYPFEVATFELGPADRKGTTLASVVLNNNRHPVELHIRLVRDPSMGVQERRNLPLRKVTCPPESIMTVMYQKI